MAPAKCVCSRNVGKKARCVVQLRVGGCVCLPAWDEIRVDIHRPNMCLSLCVQQFRCARCHSPAIWQRRWARHTEPGWACSRRPRRWTPCLPQPAWWPERRKKNFLPALFCIVFKILVSFPPSSTWMGLIVCVHFRCKRSPGVGRAIT